MRQGYNPHKDQIHQEEYFTHQVIVPVFIPHQEGYFKDSFKILQRCLESLFATCHPKTFLTIVNNGSDDLVVDYLDELLKANKIHELIHTQNIGKLNAVLKGIVGHSIPLITITDSDVLFLSHWQAATVEVYHQFPRAGVVGIVPQYRLFASDSYNVIFDHLFSSKMQLIEVKNPEALKKFYHSIGWGESNPDYLKISLGLVTDSDFKAYIGAGHFVATYRRDIFDEVQSHFGYKMGGDSEAYLDRAPLKKDYWRLTTHDNFAYHMGNVYEDWMGEITFDAFQDDFRTPELMRYPKLSSWKYFIKNTVFRKLFKNKKARRWFYRYMKMPAHMVQKY